MTRAKPLLHATFAERYQVVLEAAARRVHRVAAKGEYVTAEQLADWLVGDVWHVTQAAWWKGVRAWRVREFLRTARFLGAFEELEIKTVRGRGFTSAKKPRLRAVA